LLAFTVVEKVVAMVVVPVVEGICKKSFSHETMLKKIVAIIKRKQYLFILKFFIIKIEYLLRN